MDVINEGVKKRQECDMVKGEVLNVIKGEYVSVFLNIRSTTALLLQHSLISIHTHTQRNTNIFRDSKKEELMRWREGGNK